MSVQLAKLCIAGCCESGRGSKAAAQSRKVPEADRHGDVYNVLSVCCHSHAGGVHLQDHPIPPLTRVMVLEISRIGVCKR